MKADWERWKQNMQNDIKSAFTDMAEENIHSYEQVISDMWYCFIFKMLSSLLLSICLVLKESVQEPSVTFRSLLGGSVPVELPVNIVTLNPPTDTNVCMWREGDKFSFLHSMPKYLIWAELDVRKNYATILLCLVSPQFLVLEGFEFFKSTCTCFLMILLSYFLFLSFSCIKKGLQNEERTKGLKISSGLIRYVPAIPTMPSVAIQKIKKGALVQFSL